MSTIKKQSTLPTLTKKNDERAETQKKTFAKWINYTLEKGGIYGTVTNLVEDLKDGSVLLDLLQVVTGVKMKKERGRMRVHKLNNVNRVLQVLEESDTKLVNIGSDDIVNGSELIILALIWNIILKFQVKNIMNMEGGEEIFDLEKRLLDWCKQCTRSYSTVDIKNFTSSWRDGLAFNALIHHHRPDLFDFNRLIGRSPHDNLDNAFKTAANHLGIAALLDPEDVNNESPDKKSIMMYITTMYEVLPHQKPAEPVRVS